MNARGPLGKHQDQGRTHLGGVYFASWAPPRRARNGANMSVAIFVVLTIALFAVLGLIQKAVERL